MELILTSMLQGACGKSDTFRISLGSIGADHYLAVFGTSTAQNLLDLSLIDNWPKIIIV